MLKTIPLSRILLAAGVLLLALLAWRATPLALWAYNVQRAGALLDTGMGWPTPREVDTLPTARDEAALRGALGHLAAAIRWRPAHSHAYRLAGQSYMALGDWPQARASYAQARAAAPDDPQVAWEASLIEDQLAFELQREGSLPLLDALARDGEVELGQNPTRTPFCQPGEPSSCFFATVPVSPTLALRPEAPLPPRQALFTHAPILVRLPLTVRAETPALTFLVGLLPEAQEGGTDGATLRLLATPPQGEAETIYERTLSAEEALAGWYAGAADLTPWVGQAITLTLSVEPGPGGTNRGDWFAWADVALRSRAAAQGYVEQAAERAVMLWAAPPLAFDGDSFRWKALTYEGEEEAAAARWFGRAAMMGLPLPSDDFARQSVGYAALGEPWLAFQALDRAVRADAGWRDGAQRRETILAWGDAALRAGTPAEEVEARFERLLEAPSEPALWQALGRFWQERAAPAPLEALCAVARARDQESTMAEFCPGR